MGRWVLAAAIAIGLAVTPAPDLVLYNATASMPVGFYWRSTDAPARHAIVTVRAQRVASAYARQRGFADAHDRFIKRVAGVDGDIVCAHGANVTINGAQLPSRRRLDREGRLMPRWQGCRRLDGEVFVLGDSADSFDSRYFGPVAVGDIDAVWTR
ncbi:S26 family signal peptidase [Vitreimonas sp.]|uniref:S26 family signal peptidase n=1 Tax=Vitreimonas sp. TaxID=3069702 RepID=UPI002ED990D7